VQENLCSKNKFLAFFAEDQTRCRTGNQAEKVKETLTRKSFSKKCSFFRCNLLTYGPRPQINLIHGAGLIFLIDIRYAHARFHLYAVCSFEKTIGLAAATTN
jgi:hypothetical protein